MRALELTVGGVLEPGAAARPDDDGVVALSTAISLKRIADALDHQSVKGSVLYWLEQIASAANAGRS